MPITDAERAAAEYLAGIEDPEERKAAAGRINQLVKAKTPASEAELAIPVQRLDDYLDRDIPTPPFLVSNGQLVRGELHALIARAGKGKTTLTWNRLIRWSAGLPLFDEEPEQQAPIDGKPLKQLMLLNEGVAMFTQEKLGALLRDGGGLDLEQQQVAQEHLYVWGDGGYSNFKVDRESDLELLRRALDKVRPDVVTLEPFRGMWRGEENDSTAMEAVLDDLVGVAYEFGAAIMIGHHERKSGVGEDGEWMSAARGSGDFEGKVAVMENLRSVKNNTYTELSWSKRRYSTAPAPPMRMAFNHATWRLEFVPEDAVGTAILGVMTEDPSGWYHVNELAEALDEAQRRIRDALNDLVDNGRIVKKKADQGKTGFKYRLKHDEAGEDHGGLDV